MYQAEEHGKNILHMNNCEKYQTFSNYAQEHELPFPNTQPRICQSCDETCCTIAQKVNFYEFDPNISYEPLFDEVTQQFGMVARGKIQVDQFIGLLEKRKVLFTPGFQQESNGTVQG